MSDVNVLFWKEKGKGDERVRAGDLYTYFDCTALSMSNGDIGSGSREQY